MPTYATQANLEAYYPGGATVPAVATAYLERAERDIDALLGPWTPRADTGLKLNPADLLAWEAAALRDAVCAQARWLLAGGAPTVPATAQGVKRVKGPDFEKEYFADGSLASSVSRLFGPRVAGELARIAHLRIMGARATA